MGECKQKNFKANLPVEPQNPWFVWLFFMTKGFAQIPNEVLTDTNLSAVEKVMYALIVGKSNKEGYCWASNETFGKWVGCTPKWASSTISKLEKKKYIRLELNTKDNKTNRKIYPLITVERVELQFQSPRNYSSTNNTSSLKEKKTKKKSDDFSSLWRPLSFQGTETLKEDSTYKATNGLYDSPHLVQECKFRWPNKSPDRTELYVEVINRIMRKAKSA